MKQNNKRTLLTILISVFLIKVLNTENTTKLQDRLGTSSNYNASNIENFEDDIFKAEAKKVVEKCHFGNNGTKLSGESNTSFNRYYSRYNQSNSRTTGSDDNRYDEFNVNDKTRKSENYDPYYNYRYDDDYNSNSGRNSQVFPNKNCTKNKTGNYNANDYGNEGNYNSYRNENLGSSSYFDGAEYDKNYFNSRIKEEDGSNENQCISQCVFEYMELMDENQTPSESLVIKWLQEHLSNNNTKRIKALREARRCFARLATGAGDSEDGCEFSKQLSKCMNLEL